MRRVNSRWGTLLLRAFSALLLFTMLSCGSGGTDADDPPVAAETIVERLEGTWLRIFSSPFAYASGRTADAWIIEFEGTEYEYIFYEDASQNGGNRGTFTIQGDRLNLATTEEWSDDYSWVPGTTPIDVAFTLDGDTLTIQNPDGDVALTRTSFTLLPPLIKTWTKVGVDSVTLEVNTDATYNYAETGRTESGIDMDATGTRAGYLRAVTTKINGRKVSLGSLTPYTLTDGKLVLTYEDGDQVYQ